MKKPCKIVFIIVLAQVLLIFALGCLMFGILIRDAVFPRQYITTDINDYGKYVGNYDNDFAQEFIPSFFPKEIDDTFADVKYSYRAQKGDSYAFEAYLEFKIEDVEKFKAYIGDEICGKSVEFKYDSDFKEYIVSDEFQPTGSERNGIRYAKIGKILYSEANQRIIYVAMGVYDGGGVTTDFLCEYFNRFNINPATYKTEDGSMSCK